jgi:hypothetical protein
MGATATVGNEYLTSAAELDRGIRAGRDFRDALARLPS